ncbi:MAG: DUF4097 family beta strand repeat-containing protein [Acutalibacteraceae bacterium]|nr:DUF4097 family beta strand repeat-containing protein [Acutalibacteraceae bacterium]
MTKKTKIWIITAILFIIVGCIAFGSALFMLNFDFKKLSTVKYETNEYEITDNYDNIMINTKTAQVRFVTWEKSYSKVVCFEELKEKHSVKTEDNTLKIQIVNTKKWYDYIGVSLGSPEIIVYLPVKEYGRLSVRLSTGDIEVGSMTVSDAELRTSTGSITATSLKCGKDLKINVSTGKTYLTDVTCNNFISEGDTGNIFLKNVIANDKCDIKRSTGKVNFDNCDAGELEIETDTGSVKGSLLSEKVFIAHSDTGRINVPETLSGGKCEIETDTGDISITIVQ